MIQTADVIKAAETGSTKGWEAPRALSGGGCRGAGLAWRRGHQEASGSSLSSLRHAVPLPTGRTPLAGRAVGVLKHGDMQQEMDGEPSRCQQPVQAHAGPLRRGCCPGTSAQRMLLRSGGAFALALFPPHSSRSGRYRSATTSPLVCNAAVLKTFLIHGKTVFDKQHFPLHTAVKACNASVGSREIFLTIHGKSASYLNLCTLISSVVSQTTSLLERSVVS